MASLFLLETKKQALDAVWITGNGHKCALFNSSYTNTTAVYGVTNEVTGTAYVAGGKAMTGLATASSGTVAYGDADDVAWAAATISGIRFAAVYDDVDNDEIRAVYDFGSDQAVSSGTFTIQWPTNDTTNAMIRIA